MSVKDMVGVSVGTLIIMSWAVWLMVEKTHLGVSFSILNRTGLWAFLVVSLNHSSERIMIYILAHGILQCLQSTSEPDTDRLHLSRCDSNHRSFAAMDRCI